MSLRVSVSHIQKQYGGRAVLKDCSFSLDAPGIYALMGPNGSGKSTLLRICALLEEADGGSIEYFEGEGVLPKDIRLRRRMTLVLPRIGVFNTTVFKNVAYGLKVRGLGRRETEERADRALEAVGLIHKKRQSAVTLSSGETQRLGIARAMAPGPAVLFMDEPTASIDEENTDLVERLILDMKKDNTSMIIVTTHDRDQAARLADRILVMRGGKLIE